MEVAGKREWTIGGIPADVLKGTDAYQVRYLPALAQGEAAFDEKGNMINTVGFVIRAASKGGDESTTKSAITTSTTTSTESSSKSISTGTSTSASTNTSLGTATQTSLTVAGSSTGSPGTGGNGDSEKNNQQTGDRQQQSSQTIQLSTGALAGIIVAPVLVCFIIAGTIFWFFAIRKRRYPSDAANGATGSYEAGAGGGNAYMAGNQGGVPPDYYTAGSPWSENKAYAELSSVPLASEMSAPRRVAEMHG